MGVRWFRGLRRFLEHVHASDAILQSFQIQCSEAMEKAEVKEDEDGLWKSGIVSPGVLSRLTEVRTTLEPLQQAAKELMTEDIERKDMDFII